MESIVKALRILLLEDSLLDAELIEIHLAEGGIDCELVRVETRSDFVRAIEQECFDLILADYSLPSFDGISALKIASSLCPDVPFIFVSATLGEELAIETLKSGATDYVLKQRLERLAPAVNRAMREAKERYERKQAQEALQTLAAELEIRVQERTAELANANEALKTEIAQRQQVEESLRKSESTLRSYFELPLIGIAITSPDQKWIEVNDKLCDILGYERSQLIQKTWVELTYPEDLQADLALFNQLLAGTSEGYSLDKRFIRKDGTVIYASISVRCVRRGDGSIDYFVALVQDVTERKQAEEERLQLIQEQVARQEAEEQGQRAAFLAEASTLLVSSLDYEIALARVAELVVPYMADWCTVDLLDEENQVMRRVAIAYVKPSTLTYTPDIASTHLDEFNFSADLPNILHTHQPRISAQISDTDLIAIAQTTEHLQILQTLGLTSYMIVPLQARGRTLGTITLVRGKSGTRYSSTDLSLVEDLARRAAWAIDNAQLYHASEAARRATQKARQLAEQTAQRNASLQALTAALSEVLTPAAAAEVAVEQGLAVLKASAGFIALLTDQDQTLEIIKALGYPQKLLNRWSRFPLTADLPIADAVKTKQPILLESREVWAQAYPHLARLYASTPDHAWASIPLIVEGRTVGGMGLSFREAQLFSEEDCAFMLALARQCAQAIERARAYAAEREARAEAEAANRAKDEFLVTLSHELRTPLNAVLGWIHLLRTRQLSEDKTMQALETIDRNTNALGTLIEDILDVSRIITGKFHLQAHPCELIPVIEAAIEVVRPSAEGKMIPIHCSFDSSIGKVWGDANRLQQVVWNLLSNAIKFTPNGGQVTVRVAQGEGEFGDRPYAEIQVSDTGKGISADFLPYVFDRFRQEDGKITKSHGGLGLGLAIVRYLVEMHHGTVQVSSPGEGLGATFTVRLPLWVSPRESHSHSSASLTVESTIFGNNIQVLEGLRVLIVDDEPDARELLTTLLEQYGAQVKAAGSAVEALDYVSRSKVDLVVSDIAMPDIDGYEFMRQFRKLEVNQGESIPAIALTAYAGEGDRTLALEAGFQVHLPKPFNSNELIKILIQLAEDKVIS
ncbi:MAG TPA: hypothetical protein DCL61_05630 [Cyanobacteria bacterium UBA12227]|nr:hypothetical protein [Cyanobacteria bacterium UBA12227]HAX88281.1 hypothetical protein [Cyanobacteria bacterium UBA11370]HBY81698.1 hypothetical protein [Cyanobacteria bacterium UBA11148]